MRIHWHRTIRGRHKVSKRLDAAGQGEQATEGMRLGKGNRPQRECGWQGEQAAEGMRLCKVQARTLCRLTGMPLWT